MKRFIKVLYPILGIFVFLNSFACKMSITPEAPVNYTVEFDSKGGSSVSNQIITNGQKAVRPDKPSKKSSPFEKYLFVDWYTSTDQGATLSANPFDFNTPITSNIKLYAKWNSSELNPLAFEFINDGSVTITNPWSTLKYSINGEDLNPYTDGENIEVKSGDKVYLFAQKSENNETNYMTINCSDDCYIYGNIMSLVTLDKQNIWNSEENSVSECAFHKLFINNTHILNHNEKELFLPATILAYRCYSNMFYGCTGLTKAPALPATMLADYCYINIFNGCTNLTTAPALPAKTLANYCYAQMFYNCNSLTIAPALPATTLAEYCYFGMFNGCIGLTAAPALPATKLEVYCYGSMFQGCKGLTTAPALPAATLLDYCYWCMFDGCTNLSSIECLATDIPDSCCTFNWLGSVSSTGTFIKAPEMEDWLRNGYQKDPHSSSWNQILWLSGIPTGWTIVDKEP